MKPTKIPNQHLPSWQGVSILLLGILLLATFWTRSSFLDIPLERDEGEYAYMGQRILDGTMPFVDSYNMKLPGAAFMYAGIISLFGATSSGIHFGINILVLISLVLLYFSFARLINPTVAIIACIFYSISSASISTLGFAGHATHFINLFSFVALLFFSFYLDKSKNTFLLLAGLFWGIAFIMKQQGVFLFMVPLASLFYKYKSSFRNVFELSILYLFGYILPYLCLVIVLATYGDFSKFWFWTVQYASKYANGGVPIHLIANVLQYSLLPMVLSFPYLWILGLLGFIFIYKTEVITKEIKALLFVYTIASLLTVCPGFYFRPHYFITLLPALCVLAGLAIYIVVHKISAIVNRQFLTYTLCIGVAISCISFTLISESYYYLPSGSSGEMKSKSAYGRSPFIESVEIAKYLKRNTSRQDRIAVFGSEPQICFLANRLSATGYIYMYNMMESHGYNRTMQQEMIKEVETSRPKYIVYVNIASSWNRTVQSPMDVLNWMHQEVARNYEKVGLVEITDQFQSKYTWDQPNILNRSQQDFVLVYKRKGS